jgi:hypothetical protein
LTLFTLPVAAKAVQSMIEFASQVILFGFIYALSLMVNWQVTLLMTLLGGALVLFVVRITHA